MTVFYCHKSVCIKMGYMDACMQVSHIVVLVNTCYINGSKLTKDIQRQNEKKKENI